MPEDNTPCCTATTTGLLVLAQTAIGAGVGLLIAGRIGKTAQRATAGALIAAGLAATVPVVYDVIVRQFKGPDTARGARRRLQTIRDDGGAAEDANLY